MGVPSHHESNDDPMRPLILWENSYHLTQTILSWSARSELSPIEAVFRDELVRRNGLRAYGIIVQPKRHSSVNQISSSDILDFVPRQLGEPVAHDEAA